jgi:hypothetical protein
VVIRGYSMKIVNVRGTIENWYMNCSSHQLSQLSETDVMQGDSAMNPVPTGNNWEQAVQRLDYNLVTTFFQTYNNLRFYVHVHVYIFFIIKHMSVHHYSSSVLWLDKTLGLTFLFRSRPFFVVKKQMTS